MESVKVDRFGGIEQSILGIQGPGEIFKPQDAQNLVFGDNNLGPKFSLERIRGWEDLNTAIAGASIGIQGAHSWITSANASLIVGHSGTVWVLSSTTFMTIASSQDVFHTSNKMRIIQFRDRLIVSEGTTKPYKYNNTEFTRAGVSAPTQILSASCGAAGTLTGAYSYKYAGVNSYSVEGDVGSNTTALTLAAGRMAVSNIPTAPASHGIDSWNIYRNTAGVATTWWRVTSVTNGVTSFTDNNSDSTLATQAPSDNGTPPYFVGMVVHDGRLWGYTDNSSTLWFSNIDDPETFKSTNSLQINRGDGLYIKAIQVLDNGIAVHKNDMKKNGRIYIIRTPTTDSNDWSVVKTDASYSAISQDLVAQFLDRAVFGNEFGVYTFDRSASGEKLLLEKISEPLGTYWAGAVVVTNSACLYDFNNVLIAQPGNTTGDWYIYDYIVTKGWTRHTTFNGAASTRFLMHEGRLLGYRGGGTVIKRWLLTTSTTGSGAASTFKSQYIYGHEQHKNKFKVFRKLNLWMKNTGFTAGHDLTVTYYTERSANAADKGSFTVSGSDYSSKLGDILIIPVPLVGLASQGRTLKFELSWTADTYMAVLLGYELFYNPRGERKRLLNA